jgi:hypothetical protein
MLYLFSVQCQQISLDFGELSSNLASMLPVDWQIEKELHLKPVKSKLQKGGWILGK